MDGPPAGMQREMRYAWDAVAAAYASMLPDMRAEAPLDLSVLSAFALLAQEVAVGPVLEVGCGAGRVTSHLADRDLRVVGLDLSPAMATAARRHHPELAFAAADAAALPIRSGALGGLVTWYSLINLAPDRLPRVLAEFARVTAAGAPLLLGFQSGRGERVDRTSAYGLPVAMTYFLHNQQEVADRLVTAGFTLYATVCREPALVHETTPQTFLLARRRPRHSRLSSP